MSSMTLESATSSRCSEEFTILTVRINKNKSINSVTSVNVIDDIRLYYILKVFFQRDKA